MRWAVSVATKRRQTVYGFIKCVKKKHDAKLEMVSQIKK